MDSLGTPAIAFANQVKMGDQYRMHLLFRPGLPGSIYVPLKMVEWKWEGSAGKTGAQWGLLGAPSRVILQNNVIVPFDQLPRWTNAINQGELQLYPVQGQYTIP